MCEIFRTKDPADFLVLKIKAHQTVSPCNADLDNYAILGNTAVDFAAKSAASYNNNRLHQQAREVLDFYKKQRRMRGKFLDLTIEIDKTRMDKRKAQANKDAKHSCSPTNLLEWHPRGGVQLHVPVLNDDHLSGCPWGSAFTCLVLEWAQTLRWPVEQTEHDPGVSLVELLINFILVTGVAFPRQVSRKAARVVFRHETQAAEVAVIPCAFEEAMRIEHLTPLTFSVNAFLVCFLRHMSLSARASFCAITVATKCAEDGPDGLRCFVQRRPLKLSLGRCILAASRVCMFSHPGPCCNFGPAHWTQFQMM